MYSNREYLELILAGIKSGTVDPIFLEASSLSHALDAVSSKSHGICEVMSFPDQFFVWFQGLFLAIYLSGIMRDGDPDPLFGRSQF